MASDFATVVSEYCYSSLENKNTLAIEMRKHFTEAEAATKRCSSSLRLVSYYQNYLKGVSFKKLK